MNFDEFKATVVASEQGKMDFGTELKSTEFRYEETGVRILKTEKGDLTLSDWAMKQLCSNLGVPYSYEKRRPPEIETQVNFFLKQSNSNVIVRTKKNEIRGILPSWWKFYDNIDLVNAMEPGIKKFGMFFMLQHATETSVECRITFPKEIKGSSDLDTISGGVCLTNSEVGDSELTMNFLMFQKICSNGAISRIENTPIFNFKRQALDKQCVNQRIQLGFEKAAEFSDAKIQWFTDLLNLKLDMDRYTRVFDAMEEDQVLPGRFLKKLKEEPLEQPTMYHLVSRITHTAQILGPTARIRVETWVGNKLQRWLEKTGLLQYPG